VITVGNGAHLPVTHQTFSTIPTSSSPLYLRNVLVAPSLVKNLIYVRCLTRDNNVAIEFDPAVFQSRIFQRGRRGSDVTATVTFTLSSCRLIKLSPRHHPRRSPCGTSASATPDIMFFLKF
jgi:hypothetical protein